MPLIKFPYFLTDITEIDILRNHIFLCDSPRLCKTWTKLFVSILINITKYQWQLLS